MSEIISQYGTILLALACVFGFFMAYGVGANDVANAMGTSVAVSYTHLTLPTKRIV